MESFSARILWTRTTPDFTPEGYDRSHEVTYGSGITVAASSAPGFKGSTERMNPEEALVGAISSCHMLTFLAIAAKKQLVVESYDDQAEGFLEKNAEGRLAVTRVVLRPLVVLGAPITPEDLTRLHDQAHRGCFIANSVKTEVTVEARA